MVDRRVYDSERHAQFVTFSCYRRRELLQHDQAKRIVIGHLGAMLTKRNGLCVGFAIMPDHVHALVWFPETAQLSRFMNEWKGRSSAAIRKLYEAQFSAYWSQVEKCTVWQPRYYGFNVFSREKLEEKLIQMHLNPVRAGLVEKAIGWRCSSARWYELHKPVGLPIRWPPGMESDRCEEWSRDRVPQLGRGVTFILSLRDPAVVTSGRATLRVRHAGQRAGDRHVCHRLRQWLCARHKAPGQGTSRFPDDYLHQTLGLVKLPARTRNFSWANR